MNKLLMMAGLALGGQQAIAQNGGVETWTSGSHQYTMRGNLNAAQYDQSAAGVVTFTNVSSDYDEFERLYTEFLGKTPHGTAAMMPMAMEIYGRDRDEGLRCFQLLCYPSNVNSVVSILKEKYRAAEQGDNYGQRYLPAAVLKGATPENGYQPQEPYTVEMRASVNKHQDLTFSGQGRVVYIYIIGKGWDTQQRQVEVILQPGTELHKVFNCPSLYTQCKQIQGSWTGLK